MPARRVGGSRLSDIGPILDSPVGWAVVILVLGWPVLLAGVAAGLIIGWLVARKTRPLLGAMVGMLVGLVVAVIGGIAAADGLIAP